MIPANIIFKKDNLRKEFWNLTPKAILVMSFANWVSWTQTGRPLFVTEIYYKGGTGVHGDWRAFDSKIKDYYTQQQVDIIMGMVNANFVYDPRRPNKKTCVRHKVDKKDVSKYEILGFVPEDHLHFQVWIK